ncbi:MAG: site-specific integrase [Magnetococcales bacterium]|nr:site-specific integrase [Magnetococcales bacterium]
MSSLIETYAEEKKREGSWTPKTEQEARAIFDLLLRIVGDLPVASIGYETARNYKSTLQKLPSSINIRPDTRGKSIKEILSAHLALPKMAVRTINKHLVIVGSLFEWMKRHGHVKENFFSGMGLQDRRQPQEMRDAFDADDLEKMFSTEFYTQRKMSHPHQYWVPLIGLYTGARIEEICQLKVDDIHEIDGVLVFDINDEGDDKKLKTSSSRRIIPVHSRLAAHGLFRYCEMLKQKGFEQLFPELRRTRDGYSQAVSKWFSRYKKQCGIESTKKTFHSFRHTVADALKQKGVAAEKIGALLGHADPSMTTGRYGKAYGAKVMQDVVEMLEFGV